MQPFPPVIHEKLRFGEGDALAGLLAYPETDEPRAAVLICSPHPNFGGDMQNNVVAALAERLSIRSITLRFDYRGVGDSRIDLPPETDVSDYWDRLEETFDYDAPLRDTICALDTLIGLAAGLPIIAVGYSFGAIMATQVGIADRRVSAVAGVSPPLTRIRFEHLYECCKPALLISGRDDFVFHEPTADQLQARGGRHLMFEKPIADHFFIGLEADVAERVVRLIHEFE